VRRVSGSTCGKRLCAWRCSSPHARHPTSRPGCCLGGYSETRLASNSYQIVTEPQTPERAGLMQDLQWFSNSGSLCSSRGALCATEASRRGRRQLAPSPCVPPQTAASGQIWGRLPGFPAQVDRGPDACHHLRPCRHVPGRHGPCLGKPANLPRAKPRTMSRSPRMRMDGLRFDANTESIARMHIQVLQGARLSRNGERARSMAA
jgi:hypothetical protein